MKLNQSGLAPLIIILILSGVTAVAIGGYYFSFAKKPNPPANETNLAAPSTTPTSSLVSSPNPTVKPSIISTAKPTAKPSINPSSSPTSSPLSSASPGPTSAPTSGVYKLEAIGEFTMKVNSGYSVAATLQDSNGNAVKNQQNFVYAWSIDDASLGSSNSWSVCTQDIQDPCPNDHYILNAFNAGSTFIHVKVTKMPENQVVGERSIRVTVTN